MSFGSWWRRTAQQLEGGNPFGGDCRPSRVPMFATGRPSLPFPHLWNYREPIRILSTFWHGADAEAGAGRHNRYLSVVGMPPVLVTREPAIIQAVLLATGDKPGQFDRDTSPSNGIARATGADTLLYANGATWRRQKKLAAAPFSRGNLFQPENFHEFEQTFRATVTDRLELLSSRQSTTGEVTPQVRLEGEISTVMLEMLVNNFFGAEISYEELGARFVPAITDLIEHMVSDTVAPRLFGLWNRLTGRRAYLRQAAEDFEILTDLALAGRRAGRGLWAQFKSDAPDAALRSNVRVFLAGALEATTSFASWALTHLSRAPELQEQIFEEVQDVETYDPENLEQAVTLKRSLEETLRLTPSLYFLPRRATTETTVQTADGRTMVIPEGTHVVLDVWHANRCEEFWGVGPSGHPAGEFAPARWQVLADRGRSIKDTLHFGFGYGPRVCPGKFLGLLEVGLVVGAFVKMFRFSAVHPQAQVRAGVSTKPADGVLVELELR